MPDLTLVVNEQVAQVVTVTPRVAETVLISGPQGPSGPPGAFFEFTQATASDTWTIAHNLGVYPNVTVVDSSGREVEGDVQYIDMNNIQILFSAAFAGQAYLS